MSRAGRVAAAAALALLGAAGAPAQEFAAVAPAGPGAAPAGFLESGLPPAASAPALEATCTGWYGLPELASGALCLAAGHGTLRAAAGLAQFGAPDIGWNALGAAGGVAGPAGGAGARVVARRDRAIAPGSEAAVRLEARAGIEAGWGAWLRAGPGLTLWATVPQVWAGGTAPPLDRPLEMGARLDRAGPAGFALWLTRSVPSRDGAPDHGAGVSLAAGPLAAWGMARDHPLRGAVGVAARAGRVRVAAALESHPELGETVRLAAGLGGGAP